MTWRQLFYSLFHYSFKPAIATGKQVFTEYILKNFILSACRIPLSNSVVNDFRPRWWCDVKKIIRKLSV
jgi:hypothetical protein